MDKMAKQTLNKRLTVPFFVALLAVLLIIVTLFLPYMTAVGEMAEYIENNPDRIEIKSLNLTASDLADISVLSVNKLITGVYGEDDGEIANIIVMVLGGFLAVTLLFTLFKKPVAIIIFDLLTCGTFFFLSFLMKEDFISADTYAWGIGYYAFLVAAVIVFAAAIWMLVKKISVKKELKAAAIAQPEA